MAKEIDGQFCPLLYATMDTPAWRALSNRAVRVYISLRRRVPRGKNEAFLSYNDALRDCGGSRRSIARAFRELEHYGFIVKVRGGCLGTRGRGEATVWRLTEKGVLAKVSKTGVFEPPTRDFTRWNGIKFKPNSRKGADPKTKSQFLRWNRAGSHGGTGPNSNSGTRSVPTGEPKGIQKGRNPSSDGGTTTSLATTRRTDN